MLFIKELKPGLNTQKDSVRAKLLEILLRKKWALFLFYFVSKEAEADNFYPFPPPVSSRFLPPVTGFTGLIGV